MKMSVIFLFLQKRRLVLQKFGIAIRLFSTSFILIPVLRVQEFTPAIIPQPQEGTFFDAIFQINSNTKIVLGDQADKSDSFVVNLLNEELFQNSNIKLDVIQEKEVDRWSNSIYFGRLERGTKAKEMADDLGVASLVEIGGEGYFLQISDSTVMVLAYSSKGLFYGCMTLNQLIQAENGQPTLTGATIYDWPAFKFRGISNDLSKGQIPNLESFKKTIRFISRYKMNTYMLYLGNIFNYENHPKITEDRGFLTKDEVAELQTFAKQYHVDVIPIIETFTNFEEILSLPEYQSLAEFPGANTTNSLAEDTYQLLNEILFEISNTFSSPYLHVGGGANHQVGWHASENAVKRVGVHRVLIEHYKRVLEILDSFDKRIMLSQDLVLAHPSVLSQLPEDLIVIDVQRPEEIQVRGKENLSQVLKRRIVSPILTTGRTVFPDYFAININIKNVIQKGSNSGAIGAITAQWSQPEGPSFNEFNRFGYAFSAECSWSPAFADIERFNKIYFSQQFGPNTLAIQLIYSLLSDVSGLTEWREIWRHPYLTSNEHVENLDKEIQSLSTKMRLALQLIHSLSTEVFIDEGHLDYLKFAAQLGNWLAKKRYTINRIKQVANDLFASDFSNGASEMTNLCLEVVEDFNQIIEDFQLLWTRDYKKEDIRQKEILFRSQVDFWQEIIEQIQIGHLVENPTLQSAWIYHPFISKQSEIGSHAYFRRTFDVKPGFRKAYLQAIADSHAKIYLNGAFLDEVISGERKSTRSNAQPVKMWDITSILRPGKNVIAVEAWNYKPDSSAGINIYGEIEYELGKVTVISSDPYWKSSIHEERNWQSLGFFDIQWLNANSHETTLTIIKPNFKIGRPSAIY